MTAGHAAFEAIAPATDVNTCNTGDVEYAAAVERSSLIMPLPGGKSGHDSRATPRASRMGGTRPRVLSGMMTDQ